MLLTLQSHRVIQPGEEHEPLVFMPRKVWDALWALLEPFVVPEIQMYERVFFIFFTVDHVYSHGP